MDDKQRLQDIASGALGIIAGVLGAVAIKGVLQPGPSGEPATSVAITAVVGIVVGVVAMYFGRTKGVARQIAIAGTGIALIGIAVFGGSVALEALLEASKN
jgi:uncharacterized membrane protein YgdD (TMEM256/DUF423 family)